MRKIVLLLSIAITSIGYSQTPTVVSAPYTESLILQESTSNHARFVERMGEALKQTQELFKQSKFLKDAKEALETINSNIATGRKVNRIIDKSSNTYNLITDFMSDMQTENIAIPVAEKSLEKILDYSEEIAFYSDELISLLTNGTFKMDDGQRLENLSKLEDKIDKIDRDIRSLMSNTRRVSNLYKSYKSISNK